MISLGNLRRVINLLKELDLTISTAESCTGGLICSSLTNVDGSSEVVVGSIVSYMTRIKEEFLGVPREIIEGYGVVSVETAGFMAEGIKREFKSDISISITGYIDKIAYYGIFIGDNENIFEIDLSKETGGRSEIKEKIVEIIIGKLKMLLLNYKGEKMRNTISRGL